MKETVEAKYFDGLTSASLLITIAFDERMDKFYLLINDKNSILWEIEELEFEKFLNVLEIRNRNYPNATLKISEDVFIQKFYNVMKQKKRVDIHTRLLDLGLNKIIIISICMFCFILLTYFYILPPFAEKSAALLPESVDNHIGNLAMDSFIEENDIDDEKTEYLQEFASKLNLGNKKQFHFTVINSDEVNAFALPNGQIVVYTAILENMKSYDELVALLGHEATHINNRHSIKMLSRSLAGYMVVSLLFSDVNGIMAVLADNAQQLHSLSYSRKFEQEADEQGLKILIKNGVDPNGMVKLFEQLEVENDVSIPQIFSTHPLTVERKKNMQKIIAQSNYKVESNNKLKSIFNQIKISE